MQKHDADMRFKVGNMGYRITMANITKDFTPGIMKYLGANKDDIQDKVNQYLNFN